MALIELRHVKKRFSGKTGKVTVLKDINLAVESGDVYGIIDYSGAGRSTPVRLLNRFEIPTEGGIEIQEQDVALLPNKELQNFRKKIGMILQHFNLLWSRTVLENTMLPLEIVGVPKQNQKSCAEELVKLVGLEGRETAYPNQLSGRRKQRAGIAHALASNPGILLRDETTSVLDPQTIDEVLELLLKTNQELNLTAVLITHGIYVTRKIRNRIAVVECDETVEEDKVIDIFKKFQTEIARRLIQQGADKSIEEAEPAVEETLGQYSSGKIVHLLFHGEQAKLPIISHIVQEHQAEVSIIQGSIQQIKQGAVGSLYTRLLGEEQNILTAIEGLRKLRIETEVIGNG